MIGVACQHGAGLCALLYSGLPACEAEFQSPVCPSISGFLDKRDVTPNGVDFSFFSFLFFFS